MSLKGSTLRWTAPIVAAGLEPMIGDWEVVGDWNGLAFLARAPVQDTRYSSRFSMSWHVGRRQQCRYMFVHRYIYIYIYIHIRATLLYTHSYI